jgi:protein-disulfide isomerase
VGGAERTARKRRQQQMACAPGHLLLSALARPQAGAGGQTASRDSRKVVVGVAVAALIVAMIVGCMIWMNAKQKQTEGERIPAVTEHADLPDSRDGVVAVTGDPEAAAVVDIYSDFLCPGCQHFERESGGAIAERVAAGELLVRRHMVPMLADQSNPPGYSLEAANASLCAAEEGAFTPFHDSLFAAQPESGTRGWDAEQMTDLGRDLGIEGDGFARCVEAGTHSEQVSAEFEKATQLPELRQDFGDGPVFTTPTVLGPDGIVDWQEEGWLDHLVEDAQR